MVGKCLVAATVGAAMLWPAAASAQQVTGLSATQDVGFTTLKWDPVPGATDYQIERTPVDADGDRMAALWVQHFPRRFVRAGGQLVKRLVEFAQRHLVEVEDPRCLVARRRL